MIEEDISFESESSEFVEILQLVVEMVKLNFDLSLHPLEFKKMYASVKRDLQK